MVCLILRGKAIYTAGTDSDNAKLQVGFFFCLKSPVHLVPLKKKRKQKLEPANSSTGKDTCRQV